MIESYQNLLNFSILDSSEDDSSLEEQIEQVSSQENELKELTEPAEEEILPEMPSLETKKSSTLKKSKESRN